MKKKLMSIILSTALAIDAMPVMSADTPCTFDDASVHLKISHQQKRASR